MPRALRIDEDGQTLRLHTGAGLRPTLPAFSEPFRIGERLAGRAALERLVIVNRNVQHDEGPAAAMARRIGLQTVICAPLLLRDELLGVLTLNALSAANEVFIPLQPHFLALHGMGKLFETTALVAKRINPALKVTGIVLCLYEASTRLAQEVMRDLNDYLEKSRGTTAPWAKARLFKTRIRRNIKLAECPSFGQSIFQYAPTCHGAHDYLELAREVLGEAAAPAVLTARVEVNDRGQVGVLALEAQIRDEVAPR